MYVGPAPETDGAVTVGAPAAGMAGGAAGLRGWAGGIARLPGVGRGAGAPGVLKAGGGIRLPGTGGAAGAPGVPIDGGTGTTGYGFAGEFGPVVAEAGTPVVGDEATPGPGREGGPSRLGGGISNPPAWRTGALPAPAG